VLVSNNDARPLLPFNNAAKNNHWLGVRLIGRKCNAEAIGARLSFRAGDLKRSRMKVGAGSFCLPTIRVLCWGLADTPEWILWK
jgi:enediyne biosynthesis protein E4